MATQVQIPKLGLTMQEGTIASWQVGEGSEVTVGQVLYILETDKVETEVEAQAAGFLHQIYPEGTTLEPGEVVGWLLAQGENAPADAPPQPASPAPEAKPTAVVPETNAQTGDTANSPKPGGARQAASPKARRLAAELGVELAGVTGTGPKGRITADDVEGAAAQSPTLVAAEATDTDSASRQPISPLVRRLASSLNVELAKVAGTGLQGRITRIDVEAAAVMERAGAGAQAPAATTSVDGHKPGDAIPLRAMRGTIARRMHQSLAEMAQLTLEMDIDVSNLLATRDAVKIAWPPLGIAVPGYTDFVIKAVALALKSHPGMNATVTETEVQLLAGVNVGMAVALDHGLIVPVVHGADALGLGDIGAETTRLAQAARDGALGPDDLNGGTFSVTALGMFGIDFFTPVINPPNIGILGVGRIRDDVVWIDGAAAPTKRMVLSLTFDHRAIDGAPAAQFLGAVRDLLEAPADLLS